MADAATPADPLLVAIGSRIAGLREAKGMTVAELAIAAGLARGYVWRAESGQLNFTLSTLVRFAVALDAPMTELFAGVEVDASNLRKRPFTWKTADGTDPRPPRGAKAPHREPEAR